MFYLEFDHIIQEDFESYMNLLINFNKDASGKEPQKEHPDGD